MMIQSRITLLIAVCAALLRPGVGRQGLLDLALAVAPNVKVTVNVSQTHDVPDSLYGIFFEEVRCEGRCLVVHDCACIRQPG